MPRFILIDYENNWVCGDTRTLWDWEDDLGPVDAARMVDLNGHRYGWRYQELVSHAPQGATGYEVYQVADDMRVNDIPDPVRRQGEYLGFIGCHQVKPRNSNPDVRRYYAGQIDEVVLARYNLHADSTPQDLLAAAIIEMEEIYAAELDFEEAHVEAEIQDMVERVFGRVDA